MMGAPVAAIDDYSRAIECDSECELAYSWRGYEHWWNRDFDRSIRDFSDAIRINPRNASCYCWRGNAWVRKKKAARAIADFESAFAIEPHIHYLCEIGTVHLYLNRDWQEALQCFERALELSPRAMDYFELALIHYYYSDYDRALAILMNLIERNLHLDFPEYVYFALFCEHRLGRVGVARTLVDSHVSLNNKGRIVYPIMSVIQGSLSLKEAWKEVLESSCYYLFEYHFFLGEYYASLGSPRASFFLKRAVAMYAARSDFPIRYAGYVDIAMCRLST